MTNRHLADVGWADHSREGTVLEFLVIHAWAKPDLGLEMHVRPKTIRHHADESIDIAAVLLNDADITYPKVARNTMVPIETGLSMTFLQESAAELDSMGPGQPLFFPGYPEWHDKSASRPILRTGTISSDPRYPYRRLEGAPTNKDGNQAILFEAFSTSGSSGSPVFAESTFAADAAQGTMVIRAGVSSLLVGINAGHLVDDENGTSRHAGFSRLFKTAAIIEVLQSL